MFPNIMQHAPQLNLDCRRFSTINQRNDIQRTAGSYQTSTFRAPNQEQTPLFSRQVLWYSHREDLLHSGFAFRLGLFDSEYSSLLLQRTAKAVPTNSATSWEEYLPRTLLVRLSSLASHVHYSKLSHFLTRQRQIFSASNDRQRLLRADHVPGFPLQRAATLPNEIPVMSSAPRLHFTGSAIESLRLRISWVKYATIAADQTILEPHHRPLCAAYRWPNRK